MVIVPDSGLGVVEGRTIKKSTNTVTGWVCRWHTSDEECLCTVGVRLPKTDRDSGWNQKYFPFGLYDLLILRIIFFGS